MEGTMAPTGPSLGLPLPLSHGSHTKTKLSYIATLFIGTIMILYLFSFLNLINTLNKIIVFSYYSCN